MKLIRHIIVLVPLCLGSSLFSAEAPVALLPEKHFEFLNNYCLKCHDSVEEEGNVNLEDLSFNMGTLETAELWQKALNVLNSGEMPPEDEKQPEATAKTEFLADLSEQLVLARKILSDSDGVITMRRLNRREYENTIHDLLGVAIDAAELPKDASTGSFDTVGSSLFFSSDQFEQYLHIARRALDAALAPTAHAETRIQRQQSEDAANKTVQTRLGKLLDSMDRAAQWKSSDKSPTEFGFIDSARVKFEEGQYRSQGPGYEYYLDVPETQTGAVFFTATAGAYIDSIDLPENAPPGRYRVRARAGTFEGALPRRKYLEIGTVENGAQQGELTVLVCRKVTGTTENPEIVEFMLTIAPSTTRKIGVRERQHNNRDAARYNFKAAKKRGEPIETPALWIDWLEWEGPLDEEDESGFFDYYSLNAPEIPRGKAQARDILEQFASAAFRTKSPSTGFIDKLMNIFNDHCDSGDGFISAIKEPLAVILSSPAFLYLREPNSTERKRELNDRELAVRLSYFLWSAPPDPELFDLAAEGKLKNPSVLKQQTTRLLADPKSAEFISAFTSQWLHMDRLDFFQFNYEWFPEFDDSVKNAARQEVYETVNTLVQENLPLGKLLKSDFVVINDLLADYYDIKGVKGHQFRKVEVSETSPRGGLLGTAAILAMGSDGERSSPVERGAWVLRKLLHDAPPPAPANVPQLSRLSDEMLSARELQVAHMEEPQCAQCHRDIDPIGYGLENFDAAGQWRTLERIVSNNKKIEDAWAPIDPHGTLPDKTAFKDYFQLRDLISQEDEAFARSLTEALIEYGLGRPYGFTDYDLAEHIIASAESDSFGVRSFIHALVQSEPFRQK